MSKQAVVIYSGGMDSYTVLHKAIERYGCKEIAALTVNYAQRHKKEIAYAERVCKELGVEWTLCDLSGLAPVLQGSSLTSDMAVPEGHYAEPTMKQTVVPNRNMILLSVGIAYAVSVGAKNVYYGAHSGDHAIYPDCRPEFVDAINDVAKIANYQPVTVLTPFLHGDKTTILRWGFSRDLDYSKTWTCYNGREKACGKCGSCQERLEAFSLLGVEDPLEYEWKGEV